MSKRPVVPKSKEALNKFKMEVAKELGAENQIKEFNNKDNKGYLGNISSKEAGMIGTYRNVNVGGEMVRRMVQKAEKDMIEKSRK